MYIGIYIYCKQAKEGVLKKKLVQIYTLGFSFLSHNTPLICKYTYLRKKIVYSTYTSVNGVILK